MFGLDDADAYVAAGTLALCCFCAFFSAQTAALRGTRGVAFPGWLDALCRVTFLLFLSLPLWLSRLVPRSAMLVALLIYLPTYLDGAERKGGRPSAWVRGWPFWHWIKRRLQLSIVRTVELDPSRQYIVGLHPHGVLPFGGSVNFCSSACGVDEVLRGIELRVLAASACFYIPIVREVYLGGGAVDASRYCARELLTRHGKSIMLYPGGATEALYATPGANVLVLRKRRGFVRLALQTGADLCPVYSFGETDTFGQLSTDGALVGIIARSFQAVFGLSLPLITNIIPRRCKVTSVVGAPIKVERVEEPSPAQVEELLGRYIAAVEKLFEEHKAKYLGENAGELSVI